MEEHTGPHTTAAGVEQAPAAGSVRRRPPLGRVLRSTAVRRTGALLAVLTVSLVGVVVGVLLGARTSTEVGPFQAQMSISPSTGGGTEVDIPPLGSLHLDSHDGPVHLKVRLGALDQERTEALIDDPSRIARAGQTAVEDVTEGVARLGLRTLGAAVLCTLALAAVVFRDMGRTAWSGALALVVTGASLGVAVGTVRPDSIEEPRYEGLLVNAPSVVGDARRIADNYGKYAEQLQALIGNVSRVYATVSSLPVYEPSGGTTRVLHISDLHLNPAAWPVVRTVVEQFGIDVIIDTGDITDWGSEPEASYVASIRQVRVPYVYIRGNHDSRFTEQAVARQPNAVVLDNTTATVAGLAIAGIGDPRFTPDKDSTADQDAAGPATAPAEAGANPAVPLTLRNGQQLATTVRGAAEPVDIALVHDPVAAGPLAGTCPLVLAGHTHQRTVRMLDQAPGDRPTRLMVQGSTGAAGLRGLEGEEPLPLALSVLYFDEQQTLKAYDDIRVGGTGQAQVTLERKVVDDAATPPGGQPSPGPVSPGQPSPGPVGPGAGVPAPGTLGGGGPDPEPSRR
jgi:predicted MPP superfamily phosphohydrolase